MTDDLVPPAAISRFLDERFGSGGSEVGVERLGEGHSNLTFLVRRGVDEWVLRRPPRGDILPGTHEMSREFTVMILKTPRLPITMSAVRTSQFIDRRDETWFAMMGAELARRETPPPITLPKC